MIDAAAKLLHGAYHGAAVAPVRTRFAPGDVASAYALQSVQVAPGWRRAGSGDISVTFA